MKTDNRALPKNPLALLKPKTLLKAGLALMAVQQAGARDIFMQGPSTAPVLAPNRAPLTAPVQAPAPAPAPIKPQTTAPLFDPTQLCSTAKPDYCRLTLAKEICNEPQGQGSFDLLKQAIAQPYGGSTRPALTPEATYGATCSDVSTKLTEIVHYCPPNTYSGTC